MNSTSSHWNPKFHYSFDLLHPSFSNTHIHDILFVIGIITVCLLLLILILQFLIKVRKFYRTNELKYQDKKYSKNKSIYLSYQKLIDIENNQCKCFHYSCLPKLQCVKPTCQILNRRSYYEQINKRQSIHRVYTHRNSSSIDIHIVK